MAREDTAHTETPRTLTTSKPWLVLGISRSAWHRIPIEERPKAVILAKGIRPAYAISELEAWLKSRRRARVVQPPRLARGYREYRDQLVTEEASQEQPTDQTVEPVPDPAPPDPAPAN
jgi:hypothetical protein